MADLLEFVAPAPADSAVSEPPDEASANDGIPSQRSEGSGEDLQEGEPAG